MFIPMKLIIQAKSSVGLDIQFFDKEHFRCGALMVYETYEAAKSAYPDAEIVECDVVAKTKME